jgi:Flp pilus assembly protein TadG
MMVRIRSRIARFRDDCRGALFAEAAIALSVLATLTLGGIEVARYIILNQKLERVAATIGDLVTQAQAITSADLDSVFAAAEHVATPFDLSNDAVVIVTSVSATGANPPVVSWQYSGVGALVASSTIGTTGAAATLPADFEVRSGENVIVTEVFYNYTPWIAPEVTNATQVYYRSFYRPRVGPLTTCTGC